ncbi:MAG: hypothetical protein CCU26_10290 [Nitrospira sp. UW-LDO-01]|nr:MAG: hypothetical protein CCU26_10290 [Nitrospira sp. UW-LDO-01]
MTAACYLIADAICPLEAIFDRRPLTAGVALMGQARGVYTFFSHLKWTWVIALGYVASIGVHWMMNGRLFTP